ncbi:helix-turn-helix domain-containing protein [Aurantimonas aggregata]|uniref:Helix-turn-helix domain-containing protein n=1 Tax=Aurantimonas aggregata TaxID=2047720 RepID=A0A6L9MNB9_9HYPH|nr:helix-turn-helix transcriptional regulator [Aurantimonas aggregata]NDV89066.1 helix-turn-helix domain-containing protein [Aurantimonas aggregata]
MKAFLRARRAALQPEDVGLPRGARRRVKGLRREEVAQLAGIGLTWLTWLEQGREMNVSANALGRIARGLRLKPVDVDYVFSLMGLPQEDVSERLTATEALHNLVDGYRWPAAVLSPLLDVVVANRVMHLLYGIDNGLPPFEENHLWQLMVNPERQKLLVDYEAEARHFAALFRLTSAKYVNTPRFIALRNALLDESSLFQQIWTKSAIDPPSPRDVRLNHKVYGQITVNVTRTPLQGDQFLFLLNPADSESAKALIAI